MKNAITNADPEAQKVAQSVRPLVAIHCELCDDIITGFVVSDETYGDMVKIHHRCI